MLCLTDANQIALTLHKLLKIYYFHLQEMTTGQQSTVTKCLCAVIYSHNYLCMRVCVFNMQYYIVLPSYTPVYDI